METGHTAHPETHPDLIMSADEDQRKVIRCPACKKEVVPVHYGNGWVGACCGKLAYSGLTRPGE